MKAAVPTRRRLLAGALSPLLLALGACRRFEPRARDATLADACRPDAVPVGRTVDILVDQTTRLDAPLQNQVMALLQRQAEAAGGLWRVHGFGGRDAALTRCSYQQALASPQELEQARWRDSPSARALTQRCRATALGELSDALRTALSAGASDAGAYSPVVEAAHAVLGGRRSTRRQVLVLLSDGLQHVPGRSFYAASGSGVLVPPAARLVEDLQHDRMLPQANGVDVVHLAFGWREARPGLGALRPPREIAALETAWRAIWAAAGARSVTIGLPLPTGRLLP